jgi:hypothetical protein
MVVLTVLWRRIRARVFGILPVLDDPPPFLDTPFGDSFRRLYDEAEWQEIGHRSLSHRWTRLHYVLGLATASLAAVSGFGGLGDLLSRRTAAWLALAAAVIAATSTFLQADEQRKRHGELAAAWDNLRQDLYNTYISSPGAADRISYFRATQRRRSADVDQHLEPPPDPDGWQVDASQLQARAKFLRRGQVDVSGTLPGSSAGGVGSGTSSP